MVDEDDKKTGGTQIHTTERLKVRVEFQKAAKGWGYKVAVEDYDEDAALARAMDILNKCKAMVAGLPGYTQQYVEGEEQSQLDFDRGARAAWAAQRRSGSFKRGRKGPPGGQGTDDR